jgi:hypothetical protein
MLVARIDARTADVSDATPFVVRRQAAPGIGPLDRTAVEAGGSPTASRAAGVAAIGFGP